MKRILALVLIACMVLPTAAALAHSGPEGVKDGDTQDLAMGVSMKSPCTVDVCEVMDVFNLVLNGVKYEAQVVDLKTGRAATPDTFDPHVRAYVGDFRAAQLADEAEANGKSKEDMLIKNNMLYWKNSDGEYVLLYEKNMYTEKYNRKMKGLDLDITDTNNSGHVTLHLKDLSTLVDKHRNDHAWLHAHGYDHEWLHSK